MQGNEVNLIIKPNNQTQFTNLSLFVMFNMVDVSSNQKKQMLYEAIKNRKNILILDKYLQNFILYQENILMSNKKWIICFGTGQEFGLQYLLKQAFQSMNYSEQFCYYLKTIYFVKKWEQMQVHSIQIPIKQIYFDDQAQIKINYKSWEKGNCAFDVQKLVFHYQNQQMQDVQVKIMDYFIRISKNKLANTIVFMPLLTNIKQKIIRISFKNELLKQQFLKSYEKSYKNYVYEFMRQGYLQADHAQIRLRLNQKSNQNFQNFQNFFQRKKPTLRQQNKFLYLKFRYSNEPSSSHTNKKIKPKSAGLHFLWGNDWMLQKNGQLIYVNQQKLDNQRSVIKQLIKKIIKNITERKSIFSISLPVIIFGNQSLTQKICKCLGYAPLALEKAQNYYDKIKGAIIMVTGFSILYLQQMNKPFNSVLGETYQGQIDGCPVYAQQIMHHQPTTSFFMKGRGHYIYGSIQPKVQFGLNKIKGSNQGTITISFNSTDYTKDTIKFNFPFTQMSGLVFGKRAVKRVDYNYIFDPENSVFCKLNWGQNSNSQNQNCKKLNYMYGKVVKLKKDVDMLKQSLSSINQRHIVQNLWQIYGNWTEKIFMNNEQIFDFNQEIPFQCKDCEMVLQSHSNLRRDIIEKRADNIEQSQIEKDKIEIIQRNDKKLREKQM